MAMAIVDHNGIAFPPNQDTGNVRKTTVEIAEHAKGEVRVRCEITVPDWKEAARSATECYRQVRGELGPQG